MRRYAIFTDSCCNLTASEMIQFGIEGVVPMHFYMKGKEYDAGCEWRSVGSKEYYDAMRKGVRVSSSPARSADYEAAFREAVERGEDVLSISCAGVLSGSLSEGIAAAQRLESEFPGAVIRCVDSCTCTYPLAMLTMECARLRDQGKTIDEVLEWIEQEKLCFNAVGTVDSLSYLKKAGRVSTSSLFLGTKPVLINDEIGNNVVLEKARGRRGSLERLAGLVAQYSRTDLRPEIYIAHGDCLEEAKLLAEMIRERIRRIMPIFRFGYVEAGAGASVGPGALIAGFYGDPAVRTLYRKK